MISPCCQRPLEGGPVICWCTGCGHDVHASTVDREFTGAAPTSGAAGRAHGVAPGSATFRCAFQPPAGRTSVQVMVLASRRAGSRS